MQLKYDYKDVSKILKRLHDRELIETIENELVQVQVELIRQWFASEPALEGPEINELVI